MLAHDVIEVNGAGGEIVSLYGGRYILAQDRNAPNASKNLGVLLSKMNQEQKSKQFLLQNKCKRLTLRQCLNSMGYKTRTVKMPEQRLNNNKLSNDKIQFAQIVHVKWHVFIISNRLDMC